MLKAYNFCSKYAIVFVNESVLIYLLKLKRLVETTAIFVASLESERVG